MKTIPMATVFARYQPKRYQALDPGVVDTSQKFRENLYIVIVCGIAKRKSTCRNRLNGSTGDDDVGE